MDVIWKKIWRDIFTHPGRTVQVVLSIAVGIFAVGLTLGMFTQMNERMTTIWRGANPSHIHVGVGQGVTDDTVRAIGRIPGMAGAEGNRSTSIRWKMDLEEDWQSSFTTARQDYNEQLYDQMVLIDGSWPVSGGIAVDRGSANKMGVAIGDTVYFEVDDNPRPMQVVGVTYDVWANPPAFTSSANFYVTRRDMEKLAGPRGFNQIRAAMLEYDEDLADEKALEITDRLEELNIGNGTPETFDPDEHFFQETASGIFMLLVVMAFLTVGLSVFLVTNTITAIVAEQVPQIGVMKAVGAPSLSIFRVYLSGVIVYLVLALLIAIPLGVVGALTLSSIMLGLFNMDSGGFSISWLAVGIQLGLGLTTPIIAALWPITSGARLTVREAMSSYGLSVRVGIVERAISSLNRLPPLVILTL